MTSVNRLGAAGVGDQDTADVGRARDWLAAHPGDLTAHRVAEALRSAGGPVGDATVLTVFDALRREILGAGPLEALLRLPGVTDVLVNGADQVFLDRGEGLELTEIRFGDEAAVRRLAQRLASHAGRRIDDASPYVDARLADGTRFHAVLAPLARPGTVISLRVPARRALSLDALVPSLVRPVVTALVRRRVAFLISGGTGSGKTTLLSAMLAEVPEAERIVIVEDARELQPDHPHVVALEARPANAEGAGRVSLEELVRQALRMRPDRLVVGEVRGGEVRDLLASLNTGHEGGCGTIHANSAVDVAARLEALAMAAGMGRDAVHSQIAAGLEVVVHVERRTRQICQFAVPERGTDGLVRLRPALSAVDGQWELGVGADRLAALTGVSW